MTVLWKQINNTLSFPSRDIVITTQGTFRNWPQFQESHKQTFIYIKKITDFLYIDWLL